MLHVRSYAEDAGRRCHAPVITGARYALLKNPSSFSPRQQETLAGIEATNKPLFRVWLIKVEAPVEI